MNVLAKRKRAISGFNDQISLFLFYIPRLAAVIICFVGSVVAPQQVVCVVAQTFQRVDSAGAGADLVPDIVGQLVEKGSGLRVCLQQGVQIWIFQHHHLSHSMPGMEGDHTQNSFISEHGPSPE